MIALFGVSFAFPFLFYPCIGALVLLVTAFISDIFLLFNSQMRIKAVRKVPPVLSLGELQHVELQIANLSPLSVSASVVDELPVQMQERNFKLNLKISEGERKKINYTLRPVIRGEYLFGNINIFLRSILGLVERRYVELCEQTVAVFPNIIQMKKFELIAFSRISTLQGLRKMRRLGHSYEFEQIKNYVQGDDIRSVNWKATGRKNELMVNQYEDERAQQIYCIIDKGRIMHMPFLDLSLLDHAINTSLVITNIALRKHDKAGLVSFADKCDVYVKAEKGGTQLRKIMEQLYREKERLLESNFENLYSVVRNRITQRSLLFLFTNFESLYAMERVMPLLRKMNMRHLLVVVFFQNTEIQDYSQQKSGTVEDIYYRTIAEKFSAEKLQIVQQLNTYGIQSILTRPEELAMNTVNKYLELKSRGLV
ncbi:MAG TPA: DUF58 domain-containing protein, partial [Bacteroidetes bacterium]|nr:DUF58 domain-containing protein [Bacteroidota bacterium]